MTIRDPFRNTYCYFHLRRLPRRALRSRLISAATKEWFTFPKAEHLAWRRIRKSAVKVYEYRFGSVPAVLHAQRLPMPLQMYRTEGWAKWAGS